MTRHKAAEKFVQTECMYFRNTVATMPEEDRAGWDLYIEFEADSFDGPAEERPPRKHSFVQIKSTEKANTGDKIKLSNVQEACVSIAPWFLIKVMKDRSLRGIHIWGKTLEKWVKAVREGSIKGGPLHQQKIAVNFGKRTALTLNPAEWMLSEIEKVGPNYGQEKAAFVKAAGYADGYGKGDISLLHTDNDSWANVFLGIEKGAKGNFSFTKTRFGVPDPEPLIDHESGSITISPDPIGKCEFRVRGPTNEPSHFVVGNVYGYKHPGSSDPYLRFSAPPLEVIRRPDRGATFKMMFSDPAAAHPIVNWYSYERITKWSQLGEIDIEITSNGARLSSSKIKIDPLGSENDALFLSNGISAIRRALLVAPTTISPLSLNDFYKASSDVRAFTYSLHEENIMLEFENDTDQPLSFNTVIYRTSIAFQKLLLCCFVCRSVISDQADETRQLILSPPTIRESYAISGHNASHEELILSDYLRFADSTAEDENVLNLENLNSRFWD